MITPIPREYTYIIVATVCFILLCLGQCDEPLLAKNYDKIQTKSISVIVFTDESQRGMERPGNSDAPEHGVVGSE